MSLMRSKNKAAEQRYKPGDLRSVRHAAELLDCDAQTIHRLSEAGTNFTIITLKNTTSEQADPMYRVVWEEFLAWLESRVETAQRQTRRIYKHLPN